MSWFNQRITHINEQEVFRFYTLTFSNSGKICAANDFHFCARFPASTTASRLDRRVSQSALFHSVGFFFLLFFFWKDRKKIMKGVVCCRVTFFFCCCCCCCLKPTYPITTHPELKKIYVYACREHSLINIYNTWIVLKPCACYFIVILSIMSSSHNRTK